MTNKTLEAYRNALKSEMDALTGKYPQSIVIMISGKKNANSGINVISIGKDMTEELLDISIEQLHTVIDHLTNVSCSP